MVVGLALSVGFILGVLTIAAVELIGIVYLIRRLSRKLEKEEAKSKAVLSSVSVSELDPLYNIKQGVVWVLESEKILKLHLDKTSKDQKLKKEILEVTPVRKYAKIKDQLLYIADPDGSQTQVQLKGCVIVAVSASSFPSRKWAKRYPIKVENTTSEIYKGSKTFYIYLETSWEKESWCKALRIASCDGREKLKRHTKLNLEFQGYLASLNSAYPSFMKPSLGLTPEPVDRSLRFDGNSSKVRQFLKKLAKKTSKGVSENRAGWNFAQALEERKNNEKLHPSQESGLGTGLIKNGPIVKMSNFCAEENPSLSSSSSSLSALPNSGRSGQAMVISETESDEKMMGDEGALSWNLLISRFFFDAIHNLEIRSSIKARIQRTLSNMRIPSFVGELSCIGVDLGNIPPYIHCVRVLPSVMNEVWAMEIDIEYSGSTVLDVETRIEVSDLDFQESMVDTDEGSTSMGEMTSDLLEGFKHFQKHMKFSEETNVDNEPKNEGDPKQDGVKSSKSFTHGSPQVSRWKAILHSVAKQVSQIPLSLGIRVAYLKGTLRLYIKPPPSDQLWFCFTSMPDIDFNLESSVGEHKISSTHIAVFLINRFKTGIRDTLVLPNCESVCVPWMLAEKDDWVARSVAPFIWIKQEVSSTNEILTSQNGEAENKSNNSCAEGKLSEHEDVECLEQLSSNSPDGSISSSGPTTTINNGRLQEIRKPLLTNDDLQETSHCSTKESSECQSPSHYTSLTQFRSYSVEEDDLKPKRLGTKARMIGLGKKMGEKLEEKRRNLEERSRNIVERMRGPQS